MEADQSVTAFCFTCFHKALKPNITVIILLFLLNKPALKTFLLNDFLSVTSKSMKEKRNMIIKIRNNCRWVTVWDVRPCALMPTVSYTQQVSFIVITADVVYFQ